MAKGNLAGYMKVIREEPRLAIEILELAIDHDLSVLVACDAICAAHSVVSSRRLKDAGEQMEVMINPNAPNELASPPKENITKMMGHKTKRATISKYKGA